MDRGLIFHKKLTGQLSPEEEFELNNWFEASANNRVEYEVYSKLWSDSLDSKSTMEVNVEGAFKRFKNLPEVKSQMLPAKEKGTHGLKVALSKWSIAAGLFVVVFLAYYLINLVGNNQNHFLKYSSTDAPLNLKDGSVVNLNLGAEISYPESFKAKVRKIKLTGEAFFDIAKDPQKPFIIETAGGEIKVLGTSFNIRDLSAEKTMEVFVLSGTVQFTYQEGAMAKTLNAGDKMVFNKSNHEISISRPSGQNDISWHSRKLEFIDVPLSKVVVDLARYFHAEITLSSPCLGLLRYTSPLDLGSVSSPSVALDVIATSLQLEYKASADGRSYSLTGECK
jgi:transmembrane sensor